MKTQLRHLSVGVRDPKGCAEKLAALTGGKTAPFHPVDGGYVCLWGGWEGQFVEFYPKGTELYATDEGGEFRAGSASGGNSVHLNLTVEATTAEIVERAKRQGSRYVFRAGSGGPLHEVWIEEDFLVEVVTPDL
jgi:hypothetical protein